MKEKKDIEKQLLELEKQTGLSITRKELDMAIITLLGFEIDKEEFEKEADTPCTKCTDKGKCPGENKEAVYKICKKINEAVNGKEND